jgi:hypothetical protein
LECVRIPIGELLDEMMHGAWLYRKNNLEQAATEL